jgi:multidrug resistance efflux pump
MKFIDIAEFHNGYQFFMMRPSHSVNYFITILIFIVFSTIVWSFNSKMDDVVKTTALLRPVETISTIKLLSSGEVITKNYGQNDFVYSGDLLLQLDISSDVIELENSKKLMQRIMDNISINDALLATIQTSINNVTNDSGEAYIYSEAYLTEYRRFLGLIEIARVNFEREKSMPEILLVKQQIEDAKRELEQTNLQFLLWKNNKILDVMNDLKLLAQNKENLERRVSDIERNIRNASIFAPISGRVNEYRKFNIGDYLLASEEIIAIVPDNNLELNAELYIDPAYIAQIKIGQTVVLHFPGLPPSKFGKIEAKINLIPVDYVLGQNSSPVFIVDAAITDPYLFSPDGEKIYLRPGIGAYGRIITGQDSIMRMILKKLDFINEDFDKKSADGTDK